MPVAPYLTPAELRAAGGVLVDPQKYPDALLTALVAEFELVAEDYRGVAFTPRTAVETVAVVPGATLLTLSWPRVRSVASVVVDGVTVSSTLYRITDADSVQASTGFTAALGYLPAQAVVTYDHGYDIPTATTMPGSVLLRACREYVRICAMADKSTVPREIIGTSADGVTNRYSTPNKAQGRPTGYLEVDRLLNSLPDHRIPVFA
jgi:hypothetical protein